MMFSPFFASGALRFAFEKATTEGKICIGTLIIVSIFSWTVIITKGPAALPRAAKRARNFSRPIARPRPAGHRPARRGI